MRWQCTASHRDRKLISRPTGTVPAATIGLTVRLTWKVVRGFAGDKVLRSLTAGRGWRPQCRQDRRRQCHRSGASLSKPIRLWTHRH